MRRGREKERRTPLHSSDDTSVCAGAGLAEDFDGYDGTFLANAYIGTSDRSSTVSSVAVLISVLLHVSPNPILVLNITKRHDSPPLSISGRVIELTAK